MKRVGDRSVIALAFDGGCELVLLPRPIKLRGEVEVGILLCDRRWCLPGSFVLECFYRFDVVRNVAHERLAANFVTVQAP